MPPYRTSVISAPIDEVDLFQATDLSRRPFDAVFSVDVVNRAVRPPAGREKRQGLIDFFDETPRRVGWRVEYTMLLKAASKSAKM